MVTIPVSTATSIRIEDFLKLCSLDDLLNIRSQLPMYISEKKMIPIQEEARIKKFKRDEANWFCVSLFKMGFDCEDCSDEETNRIREYVAQNYFNGYKSWFYDLLARRSKLMNQMNAVCNYRKEMNIDTVKLDQFAFVDLDKHGIDPKTGKLFFSFANAFELKMSLKT